MFALGWLFLSDCLHRREQGLKQCERRCRALESEWLGQASRLDRSQQMGLKERITGLRTRHSATEQDMLRLRLRQNELDSSVQGAVDHLTAHGDLGHKAAHGSDANAGLEHPKVWLAATCHDAGGGLHHPDGSDVCHPQVPINLFADIRARLDQLHSTFEPVVD
jgi:hypothetical protein